MYCEVTNRWHMCLEVAGNDFSPAAFGWRGANRYNPTEVVKTPPKALRAEANDDPIRSYSVGKIKPQAELQTAAASAPRPSLQNMNHWLGLRQELVPIGLQMRLLVLMIGHYAMAKVYPFLADFEDEIT
jgi:hypothetical protein